MDLNLAFLAMTKRQRNTSPLSVPRTS